MNRWRAGAIVTMLLALGAVDAAAQRGAMRRGGGPGPGLGPEGGAPGIERILRLREDLSLTDAQVEQLEAIRRESVGRRTSHRAEVEELASRLRAGQVEEEAFRERVRALRESTAEEREAERERVDAILDETQRDRLEELNVRARGRMGAAGRGGYAPGMGPGARGWRGGYGPGDVRGPRARMWRRGFGPGGGGPGAWAPMRRGPRFPRWDASQRG